MGSPMSDEGKLLLRLLEDHEWHDYSEVVARLRSMVAPGKALRRYETTARNRELHKGPRVGPPLTDEEKIASGQKSVVTDTVASLKLRFVEVRTGAAGKQIRRRPTPLPIADPRTAHVPRTDAPEDGSGRDTGPAGTGEPTGPDSPDDGPEDGAAAFYNAGQIRALLSEVLAEQIMEKVTAAVELAVNETVPGIVGEIATDVVNGALDDFGDGMQRWLIGRFAEIERTVDAAAKETVRRIGARDREHRPQPPSSALPRALRGR